jgi:hypothetical protein
MDFRPTVIVVGVLTAGAMSLAQMATPDVIAATGGDLTILPITHASVDIRYGPNVILIDPARFGPGLPPGQK